MDLEMVESGRQLEQQVARLMQLLDSLQPELARVSCSPEAASVASELARRRADLDLTIGKLQQGQVRLEQRLQEHASQLAQREATLDASRAALRTLTRRLVQVQEDERRALARDLHDTSSQGMTVLGLGLAMLKRECGCSGTAAARIEELQRTAASVSEELHRLSANLRPATLDRYGLVPAAEELVGVLRDQAAIDVAFEVEGLEERLPGDIETALYRIIQEGCTNITRYACASRASISIRREVDRVRVSVEDDGRGFDVEEALERGGLGLVGMRERAEMLGGSFKVGARPGGGTRLLAEAPVLRAREAVTSAVAEQSRTAGRASPVASSEAARSARARALSDALAEIMAGMSSLVSEHEVLAYVLGRAADAVGCDYGLIALRDGPRWTITHAYGLPQAVIGQRLMRSAVLLAEEIERTRAVVVVNDAQADDPLADAARETGVFSGAGIPLIAAGRLLGAVAFAHSSDPVPFTTSEVAFLRHLGSVISLLLEIIQLRG